LGRDEIRRRNLIEPLHMPYATPVRQRDGSRMVYDSGDYPQSQERALAAAGFADFPKRQEAARRQGRSIGIGLGNYVEGTGRGPFESASVRVGASGRIMVSTGATAQGQGTQTMLAQLVAGVLGTSPADIHVVEGVAAAIDYQPTAMTYCNGTHVVEAEVDRETGAVWLRRYVVVHDCGRMINPMMVEGQVHGGVVHGIGATLFERMLFDAAGQPLTANYGDYLLPTSAVVPPIEIHHMESPSPLNPLGVKGAAESGTVGACNAIVSAIEDALRPLQVRITDLPVTPARLLALICDAQAR